MHTSESSADRHHSDSPAVEDDAVLRRKEWPSRPIAYLEIPVAEHTLGEAAWADKAAHARKAEQPGRADEQVPLPYPGFELASFAMPASRNESGQVHGRFLDEAAFRRITDAALRPMIEQLPLGAGLITEFILLPKDHGGLSLSCRIRIEAREREAPQLASELAVCLATLSDHIGFRAEPSGQTAPTPISRATWVIRPASVMCASGASGIGFTSDSPVSTRLSIPIPEVSRQADMQRAEAGQIGGLRQFFKAARAHRKGLRVRIRLLRDTLPENTSDLVARVIRQAPAELAETDSAALRVGRAAWSEGLEFWSDASGDILRLSVEVDSLADAAPSGVLLRMLADCLFPGYQVDIVPKASMDRAPDSVIDLAGALPLCDPLPPMLPSPAILESFEYPRHFDNPMVSSSQHGLLLGHAQIGGFERPVHIADADRSRHVYLLGATGTGKSTLMLNMLRQDMQAGHGVALIDPHGDLFEQVLASVPPERKQDLLIIDPDDPDCPVGLNPFDFDGNPSLAKVNRVINDFLDIFAEIWNMAEAGGPVFEQYFRNTFLLACATPENEPPEGLPEGPPTLLTANELMRNRRYRTRLLQNCETSFLGSDVGSEVTRFFQAAAETTGDIGFANIVPYITSKVTRFTNNPIIRKLLCAPKRTIDFRAAIDRGAIVLVRLSKGRLGELDTRMVGMLITKYFFHAALSRDDLAVGERRPFYLYLDEFQNVITKTVPGILSEARKFGLHLILAHQTLGQLKDQGPASTLDSLLGNVATRLYFRVGQNEAKALENEFLPHFDARAMTALPDRYLLAHLLVNNHPSAPFVLRTPPCEIPVIDKPVRQRVSGILCKRGLG